jgi:SagB-type dehydrogenase family enzyme
LRAPAKGKPPRIAAPTLSARLNDHVDLDVQADGSVVARIQGYAVGLGKLSADAGTRARQLDEGLPLDSFAADGSAIDQEVDRLVQRLARSGLIEYCLQSAHDGSDLVVIEPQLPDYWPQVPKLADADTVVLSRFAYLRRRNHEMVLESPRAGALFRICDPSLAAAVATLATPQKLSRLRRQDGFPGIELLALLADCKILFSIGAGDEGLRATEGDENLVLWDFHDLLFHTHSTEGRQASPIGGMYPYASVMAPPPAVRPRWPGKKVDLRKLLDAAAAPSPIATLLLERHSTRGFDDGQPITLAELSRFLDHAARIKSKWKSRVDLGNGGPMVAYTGRPYPSGGSAYELEIYLTVGNCAGLPRGFYHYDADGHALMPIAVATQDLDAQLKAAVFAMDAPGTPQILITIAARFNRIAWKYTGIAYALVLKDVGVLIQTLYLMATDLGLGGCAIGTSNIDRFAKMTGIEFHIEGPVGQFALGRAAAPEVSG